MKHILLLFGFVITISVSSVSAQQNDPAPPVPDKIMRQVVSRIFESYFKPSPKLRTIIVWRHILKPEWSPKIKNVKFVLVDDKKIAGRSDIYFFKDLHREGSHFTIEFGRGDPGCSATGDQWAFRINRGQVRVWHVASGWGTDCSSG
jgi:hypothetical protein